VRVPEQHIVFRDQIAMGLAQGAAPEPGACSRTFCNAVQHRS